MDLGSSGNKQNFGETLEADPKKALKWLLGLRRLVADNQNLLENGK